MDRRQTRMDRATRTRWPGTFAPMRLFLLLVPLGMVLGAAIASADPGDTGPFRRTTPRASLDRDAGGIVVGIPAGRAWGIESGLTPLDGVTTLRLDLAVDDPDVAEAFVRVAYYARGDARSRQLATQDSPFVRVGEDRRIVIDLSPPPGAVAYRVRVLGRLAAGALLSRRDAIRALPDGGPAERGRVRPPLTRLQTDRW